MKERKNIFKKRKLNEFGRKECGIKDCELDL